MKDSPIQKQAEISRILNVKPHFIVEDEIKHRISFIKNQLRNTQQKNLILGISGGIDSAVTGRLAQMAVEQLRKEHFPAHFVAVRLPYGTQADESDAQIALNFIKADQILIVNIKKACDESLQSIKESYLQFSSEHQEDFVLGNIKARQRMIVQYAIANTMQGMVLGTDHAAEALMGFFTKFGDGACDIAPLTGLTKRRIKSIAQYLGAPASIINKIPTADLENLKPQCADEDVHGITYEVIDDYLEGKKVPNEVEEHILKVYSKTEHKRNLPVTPM